ncbi:MAG: hypothetical protein PHV93_01585 [Candidatus Pacebacteria bacterium]|nr:hypothetical protein [Candidatus Paceibacterota bacterium]
MKHFFQKKKTYLKRRGVTVLVASLVASILLAIGLSIFNTTVKDLFFAATAKESQIAFYAADTAAECAQYWDYKGAIFATSSNSIQTVAGSGRTCVSSNQDITSGAKWVPTAHSSASPAYFDTQFQISFTTPNNACADVTVTKTALPDGINSATTISAYGYDTSCADVNSGNPNPRTVQRGVEFSY